MGNWLMASPCASDALLPQGLASAALLTSLINTRVLAAPPYRAVDVLLFQQASTRRASPGYSPSTRPDFRTTWEHPGGTGRRWPASRARPGRGPRWRSGMRSRPSSMAPSGSSLCRAARRPSS